MPERKMHPWRLCPFGYHFVNKHLRKTKKNKKVHVRSHCRVNSSKKDQLYPDEIIEISSKHMQTGSKLPNFITEKFDNSADFDELIVGWTQFWNETLNPNVPLDPLLVKALIATESGFKVSASAKAGPGDFAHGLLQITDNTIKILKNENGELKDYLININQNSANVPQLNVAAGIRWLFHKKKLLEQKLKREVTWIKAALEYKAYTKKLKKKDPSAIKQANRINKLFKELKKSKVS